MDMARKKVRLQPATWQVLGKMGKNIKKARSRRNIRAVFLAEQAGISADTLSAIEHGVSTVSIGAYAVVLAVLGMEKDFEMIAIDEDGKQEYQECGLHRRKRATGTIRKEACDEKKI